MCLPLLCKGMTDTLPKPLLHIKEYRVTTSKVLQFAGMGLLGAIHGGREALNADPRVFEKKFGASPTSFFGSRQWERKYVGNTPYTPDGRLRPLKSQLLGNFGRDYYHTSNIVCYGGTAVFYFGRGASKQKLHHKLLDALIGSACYSGGSLLTYTLLRK